MSTKFVEKVCRVIFIFVFAMGTVWVPGTSARADDSKPSLPSDGDRAAMAPIANPSFVVELGTNNLDGWEWTPNSQVTLAINGTDAATFPTDEWGTFGAAIDGWDPFAPGMDFVVSDGVNTKTLTTAYLEITSVSPDVDNVSGLADSGQTLEIWVNDSNVSGLQVTANPFGRWTANFSGLWDIGPGTNGSVQISDNDSDGTWMLWHTNPIFGIRTDQEYIDGRDWTPQATVQVTVGSCSTSTLADEGGFISLYLWNVCALQTGDTITLTDGLSTKEHVTTLVLTGKQVDADTVYGTAAPGVQVEVSLDGSCDQNGCPFRLVTADGNGDWIADFSVPGEDDDEQHLVDIGPATRGAIRQYDQDGDFTQIFLPIPDPRMDAWYQDGDINAYEWPFGTQLTLDIEDPATVQSPDYSTQTNVNEYTPWDPTITLGTFHLNGAFEIQPGMTLTISGASMTKELVVSNLTITNIHLQNDIITGGTEPNQSMWMWFNSQTGTCCRGFQADGNGVWIVDYSQPGPNGEPVEDLHPGSFGTVNAIDADGDNTSLNWNLVACYALTTGVNPTGGGSLTADPTTNCPTDGTKYAAGTQVTLTATPNTNWTFSGWTGDVPGTDNPLLVTMDVDKSVTASFSSNLIFADAFETGDFSKWSACITDVNDLSATTNAKLAGNYGMQAQVDNNAAIYCTSDHPNAERRYIASFSFDPNTITMGNNNVHVIFGGYLGTSTLVVRLQFRRSSNLYQVQASILNDGTTWRSSTWQTISDAPHQIKLDWRAATAPGANDGRLTLWIDAVQKGDLTAVDNDTRRIDRARLGAVTGIDTGTRGTYFFDEFESRSEDGTPTPTATLTVNKTGAGSGTVTSNPAGIDCGSTCSFAFNLNTAVTLTAVSAPGSAFTGWSGGGCSGTGTCIVTLSANTSVTANFGLAPPADAIFADGFETGNLSRWTACIADVNDLSVTTNAKLAGTYGMQALIDDNNAIYCTDDTPNAETRYRARFYFDPNSITMVSGNAHFIFNGFMGNSTAVMRVEFRYFTGAYQIRGRLLNDVSTWTDSAWFTISDAAHAIEVDWRAATAAGANDGRLTLWIDGTQMADLTAVDNDTRRIDRVRLGAVAVIDTGTRGTYYFDAFESRRQTYIGP
jgi:hypothetical protein